MPQTRFDVHGITVDLGMLGDGQYDVLHGLEVLGQMAFRRVDGKPRWFCGCGGYDAVKPYGVLAHLVGSHTSLGKRPPVMPLVASLVSFGSATSPTYLRYAGQHPDPTADAALRAFSRR